MTKKLSIFNAYKDFFISQVSNSRYVESIASGLVAGINAVKQFKESKKAQSNAMKDKESFSVKRIRYDRVIFPDETMIGALTKYVVTPNEKFQPMNANFGILPELSEKIRDKKVRYEKIADRAINKMKNMTNIINL